LEILRSFRRCGEIGAFDPDDSLDRDHITGRLAASKKARPTSSKPSRTITKSPRTKTATSSVRKPAERAKKGKPVEEEVDEGDELELDEEDLEEFEGLEGLEGLDDSDEEEALEGEEKTKKDLIEQLEGESEEEEEMAGGDSDAEGEFDSDSDSDGDSTVDYSLLPAHILQQLQKTKTRTAAGDRSVEASKKKNSDKAIQSKTRNTVKHFGRNIEIRTTESILAGLRQRPTKTS